MKLDTNQQAFLDLLRAGLWEQGVRLSDFKRISFGEVQKIAESQSAVGLVAAGLEHVTDDRIPKEDLLQFVGSAL